MPLTAGTRLGPYEIISAIGAQSQRTIDSPHFSPDSKWVSYNTNETGPAETWVATFPAFDKRRQASAHGGGAMGDRGKPADQHYRAPASVARRGGFATRILTPPL